MAWRCVDCSRVSRTWASARCSKTASRSCRAFRKSCCGGSRLRQSVRSSLRRRATATGSSLSAAMPTLRRTSACPFAVLQVCDIGSAAADRGLQKEFEAIIAAVIGGTLLTGGYGSVVGACFGALIFGVVQIGITYTNVSSDWFRVFLGVMLLIAVLFNHYVRRRVAQS